jgi:flagellar biosynthesis/type III secretory pathway chaperone
MDVQPMHHDFRPLLEELQGILQAEIEAYEQLLEYQQAEKQLLVARDLEPFLTHLQAKEHLLQTMSQLEHKRQQLLHRLAPLLGFPNSEVTLHQLSMRVPAPFSKTLLQYRSRLQGILQPLQRCNRDNARLLQDSLTLIDETRRFLAALVPDSPTYQRSGTFLGPRQGRLLSGTV